MNNPIERVQSLHTRLPVTGMFENLAWRMSPQPFSISPALHEELQSLGRCLLAFYRAVNLLYRKSLKGSEPAWVAEWLDRGKSPELLELQRARAFKNEIPRVIRPDVLLTEQGVILAELDSVPGGIGLTAWLNQSYSAFDYDVVGGPSGMLQGFASIFGQSDQVSIIVSEESKTYRPELEWLCQQLGPQRFAVQNTDFFDFKEGQSIYRFFELFDLRNIRNAEELFALAATEKVNLTPPVKPIFEEKLLFALFWNRNLREYWRRELSEKVFIRLQKCIPYTWLIDPQPLPPQATFPELQITDWQQLKDLSQRERDLILKVSGYSAEAWGSRGVFLGSDLSKEEWSEVVDRAIAQAGSNPFVLQRYHKPILHEVEWVDVTKGSLEFMSGRVRLCPYYFVTPDPQSINADLGGILATICPADKKLIHGMQDAVITCCSVG